MAFVTFNKSGFVQMKTNLADWYVIAYRGCQAEGAHPRSRLLIHASLSVRHPCTRTADCQQVHQHM